MLLRPECQKLLVASDGEALNRIGGIETELGFKALVLSVSGTEYDITASRLFSQLHGGGLGINVFDCDGTRRYVDVGDHPEYAGREGDDMEADADHLIHNYLEAIADYTQAAAHHEEKTGGKVSMRMYASSADMKGNTWASHTNYLTRRELAPSDYEDALMAHNVSRIVWEGAGYVVEDKLRPGNFRYYLSERAGFFRALRSEATTMKRPIVNTRDEPLADQEKYRRIHDIATEASFSPTVNILKRATTSIILRACELGVDFSDLVPTSPLRAIREISRDPTLKVKIKTRGGNWYTGIELQRKLAERSLAAAKRDHYITEQELKWGDVWLKLLDQLESDPHSVTVLRQVQWPMKEVLIERALNKNDAVEEQEDGSSPRTPLEIAQATSLQYARLLPTEGTAMQLLRKGRFDHSPTSKTLKYGSPLPETRAKLRSKVISLIAQNKIAEAVIYWNFVKFKAMEGRPEQRFAMNDPYATEPPELIEYIRTLAA